MKASRDYDSGPCSGNGCNFTHNCRLPTVSTPSIEVLPQANGTFNVRLKINVHAPWNLWAKTVNPNGGLTMSWFDQPSVPSQCASGYKRATCNYLDSDHVECWIEKTGLNCETARETPYDFGTFSFLAEVCGSGCLCEQNQAFCPCRRKTDQNNISFAVTAETLGREAPTPDPCDNCLSCKSAGPGKANAGGGPSRGAPPKSGPGAMLRYAAQGAGHPGFPGTPAWNETLGRYWSHDYAERIVPDPDDSRVWLITKTATFHRFSGLAGGVYTTVSPSDEERQLHRTGTGWELIELDGTVHEFDPDGLWLRTEDRNGNAKIATYSAGRLAEVTFPDGRSETFAYHPDGKLASITEQGV